MLPTPPVPARGAVPCPSPCWGAVSCSQHPQSLAGAVPRPLPRAACPWPGAAHTHTLPPPPGPARRRLGRSPCERRSSESINGAGRSQSAETSTSPRPSLQPPGSWEAPPALAGLLCGALGRRDTEPCAPVAAGEAEVAVRRNFLAWRVAKRWGRLPGDAGEPPSVQVVKACSRMMLLSKIRYKQKAGVFSRGAVNPKRLRTAGLIKAISQRDDQGTRASSLDAQADLTAVRSGSLLQRPAPRVQKS